MPLHSVIVLRPVSHLHSPTRAPQSIHSLTHSCPLQLTSTPLRLSSLASTIHIASLQHPHCIHGASSAPPQTPSTAPFGLHPGTAIPASMSMFMLRHFPSRLPLTSCVFVSFACSDFLRSVLGLQFSLLGELEQWYHVSAQVGAQRPQLQPLAPQSQPTAMVAPVMVRWRVCAATWLLCGWLSPGGAAVLLAPLAASVAAGWWCRRSVPQLQPLAPQSPLTAMVAPVMMRWRVCGTAT